MVVVILQVPWYVVATHTSIMARAFLLLCTVHPRRGPLAPTKMPLSPSRVRLPVAALRELDRPPPPPPPPHLLSQRAKTAAAAAAAPSGSGGGDAVLASIRKLVCGVAAPADANSDVREIALATSLAPDEADAAAQMPLHFALPATTHKHKDTSPPSAACEGAAASEAVAQYVRQTMSLIGVLSDAPPVDAAPAATEPTGAVSCDGAVEAAQAPAERGLAVGGEARAAATTMAAQGQLEPAAPVAAAVASPAAQVTLQTSPSSPATAPALPAALPPTGTGGMGTGGAPPPALQPAPPLASTLPIPMTTGPAYAASNYAAPSYAAPTPFGADAGGLDDGACGGAGGATFCGVARSVGDLAAVATAAIEAVAEVDALSAAAGAERSMGADAAHAVGAAGGLAPRAPPVASAEHRAAAAAHEAEARQELDYELRMHLDQAEEVQRQLAASEATINALRTAPIAHGGFAPPPAQARPAAAATTATAARPSAVDRTPSAGDTRSRIPIQRRRDAAGGRQGAPQAVALARVGAAPGRARLGGSRSIPTPSAAIATAAANGIDGASVATPRRAVRYEPSAGPASYRSPPRAAASDEALAAARAAEEASVVAAHSGQAQPLLSQMRAALQLVQSLHKQLTSGRRQSAAARLKLTQNGADACAAFYRHAASLHALHADLESLPRPPAAAERVPSTAVEQVPRLGSGIEPEREPRMSSGCAPNEAQSTPMSLEWGPNQPNSNEPRMGSQSAPVSTRPPYGFDRPVAIVGDWGRWRGRRTRCA